MVFVRVQAVSKLICTSLFDKKTFWRVLKKNQTGCLSGESLHKKETALIAWRHFLWSAFYTCTYRCVVNLTPHALLVSTKQKTF